jgi:dihydrofolate reductase
MIALIAAVAFNGVIGNRGHIPWKIEGEQERFRMLTTGRVVIMGRRTFEEIGKRLPNRMTLVLSRTKEFKDNNLRTFPSLRNALDYAYHNANLSDIFIAGGARVYEEALPLCKKLYITEISRTFDGDTYFPDFNKQKYKRSEETQVNGEIPYVYVTYTRKHLIRQTTGQC